MPATVALCCLQLLSQLQNSGRLLFRPSTVRIEKLLVFGVPTYLLSVRHDLLFMPALHRLHVFTHLLHNGLLLLREGACVMMAAMTVAYLDNWQIHSCQLGLKFRLLSAKSVNALTELSIACGDHPLILNAASAYERDVLSKVVLENISVLLFEVHDGLRFSVRLLVSHPCFVSCLEELSRAPLLFTIELIRQSMDLVLQYLRRDPYRSALDRRLSSRTLIFRTASSFSA